MINKEKERQFCCANNFAKSVGKKYKCKLVNCEKLEYFIKITLKYIDKFIFKMLAEEKNIKLDIY